MTIRELIPLLNAKVLCGEENLDQEVRSACGSDLMSDVLAFVKDKAVLITGLTNVHVMRTAEMLLEEFRSAKIGRITLEKP